MRRAQRAAAACFAAAYTVQGYANDANSTHRAQPPAATNVRSTDLRDDAGGRGRGDSTRWPRLIVIPETRAVLSLFTIIRDRDTPHGEFASAADRLMRILAEEGLANMPGTKSKRVETPCGTFEGLEAQATSSIAAVSIVRAGDALLEAARGVLPGLACGKILIQRDETTAMPLLFYVKLPESIARRSVLLVDPMLATGGSVKIAIAELLRRGVKEENIVFLNVVACPEGLDALFAAHPKVLVVTGAVDTRLNEQKYIVPGLGDFGDRYFATS